MLKIVQTVELGSRGFLREVEIVVIVDLFVY